jgi:hypothetical protein
MGLNIVVIMSPFMLPLSGWLCHSSKLTLTDTFWTFISLDFYLFFPFLIHVIHTHLYLHTLSYDKSTDHFLLLWLNRIQLTHSCKIAWNFVMPRLLRMNLAKNKSTACGGLKLCPIWSENLEPFMKLLCINFSTHNFQELMCNLCWDP